MEQVREGASQQMLDVGEAGWTRHKIDDYSLGDELLYNSIATDIVALPETNHYEATDGVYDEDVYINEIPRFATTLETRR